jgi:multiple sugar transport system permease protein
MAIEANPAAHTGATGAAATSGSTTLAIPQAAAQRLPGERHNALGELGLYAALIALSALFTVPFLWLVLTSLRPPDEVFAPGLLPSEIHWKNYTDVFRLAPVATWFRNSVIISLLAVASTLLSSSLVAYGFARLRFPGRKHIFALVMATQLMPGAATMVPTFLIWNKLGAVNTFFPLWAGNLFGSAFYIFMLRQFLMAIPQDLVEAARIDGASYFGIYWRIMLPLIKPALVAVAIFEFQAKWNDFMGPLIYLNQKTLYPLALGLQTFKVENETNWALLMAASVVFTLPMILLFFVFQRYFIEGISTTGLKS